MRLLICVVILGVVAGFSQSSKTNYVQQQNLIEEKATESTDEANVQRMRTDVPRTESAILSTTEITPAAPISSASAELFTTTAALLQAMIGSAKPELEINKPLTSKPLKEEENSAASTAANPIPEEESASQIPITFPSEDPIKRRVISYDQRQEGQYNIRADLENFMIVLIPPSPVDGLNLLDILTKSAQRPIKNKRKYLSASGYKSDTKYRQNLKAANTNFNLNYLPRAHSISQQPPVSLVESVSVQRLPNEFIEGRTPYRVDISASDDEQSRLLPNRQVDVLPPPFPLAYQHLIKPFHLEAEPTVIQTLPPAEIAQKPASSTGNFLDSYNQLLASSLNAHSNNVNNDGVPGESSLNGPGYYRMSRTIRNDNYLNTNRLVPSNSISRISDLPMYRADMSFGAANSYPPLDVPRFIGYLRENDANVHVERIKTAKSDEDSQQLDEIMFVPAVKEAPELGAAFIDTEAKSLLSDGNLGLMERCAPGHRRDSYGICREIEGY